MYSITNYIIHVLVLFTMFILYIFNTTLKYSFLKLFYQFTKIKLPRVHVQFEEKK